MVINGSSCHGSDALKVSASIHLLQMPPYAPEFNPVEHRWDGLREKFFHNRAFHSLEALNDQLARARHTGYTQRKSRTHLETLNRPSP